MELFTIENNRAKPSTHVLLIPPFTEIWERDSSIGKGKAIQDFTYIEFMCSPKSSNVFFGYSEQERGIKIQEALLDEDYVVDDLVLEGIRAYKEFLEEASYSYSFLIAAREGSEKIKSFFKDVDLNERNEKGALVFKLSELTRALKDTEDIIRNLQSLEKRVFDEIKQTKTKGNKEINPFER